MKSISLALLLSAAILPSSASAEIKAGSVEISPFIGYNIFESRQNLEDMPVFGGRIGYNFTERFGIEAVGEFIRSNVDNKQLRFTQEGQFTSPKDQVDITMYHIDLIYHFMPSARFNPFIAAGYGAAHYSPKINNENMSVVNFGAGAKYWLNENIALRLDLRDSMIFDDQIHNLQATMGVVFAFGGTKKTEPTAVVSVKDSDGDGVEDGRDQCPDTPRGVTVDMEGCPIVAEKVVILVSEPKVEEKIKEKVKAATVAPKVIILAFEDVHFGFDQSDLKPEAQAVLKRNIQLLKENPKAKIRVAGYTSASGTKEYNQKLSERRAEAVKSYLISEGIIKPERLSTIGFGETYPATVEAAPTELYSPAAKSNMRVLFEIILE